MTAKCQDDGLQIEVADNGPVEDETYLVAHPKAEEQTASSHTGVGVKNIVDRLNVLYPDTHSFKIIRGQNEGYPMQISIPMEHS